MTFVPLSTSKPVFPSYQGQFLIKGTPDTKNLNSLRQLFFPHPLSSRTKRKEREMREKEREGSTKGKGGLYKMLYKMLQIPTLPPKWLN